MKEIVGSFETSTSTESTTKAQEKLFVEVPNYELTFSDNQDEMRRKINSEIELETTMKSLDEITNENSTENDQMTTTSSSTHQFNYGDEERANLESGNDSTSSTTENNMSNENNDEKSTTHYNEFIFPTENPSSRATHANDRLIY